MDIVDSIVRRRLMVTEKSRNENSGSIVNGMALASTSSRGIFVLAWLRVIRFLSQFAFWQAWQEKNNLLCHFAYILLPAVNPWLSAPRDPLPDGSDPMRDFKHQGIYPRIGTCSTDNPNRVAARCHWVDLGRILPAFKKEVEKQVELTTTS